MNRQLEFNIKKDLSNCCVCGIPGVKTYLKVFKQPQEIEKGMCMLCFERFKITERDKETLRQIPYVGVLWLEETTTNE